VANHLLFASLKKIGERSFIVIDNLSFIFQNLTGDVFKQPNNSKKNPKNTTKNKINQISFSMDV